MAVNRDALVLALEQYGIVEYCDSHLDLYYIVVMSSWYEDENTFFDIANQYIIDDYPLLTNFTLVDGVLKAQYNKGQ